MKAPGFMKFKTPRHSKKWYEIHKLIKFGQEHTKKKFRRKLIKNGYAVCPACNGERVLKKKKIIMVIEKYVDLDNEKIRTRKSLCIKCRGKGIVDWVSRVTGGTPK